MYTGLSIVKIIGIKYKRLLYIFIAGKNCYIIIQFSEKSVCRPIVKFFRLIAVVTDVRDAGAPFLLTGLQNDEI